MKGKSLRETLKDVVLRPPKKLNALLISDIHSKCISAECLDDILASGFFENVAWRYFHADVTNSHLELILDICSYECDALFQKSCFELLEKDQPKLTDLISRVLKSTLTFRKQDTKLQSSIFLFLRVTLALCPAQLEKHDFFPKWKSSMFSSYVKSLRDVTSDTPETITLRHCFLFLCIACAVSPHAECKKIVVDLYMPFRFIGEQYDFRTQRLAGILGLLLDAEYPSKTFTEFQIFVGKSGLEKKLASVEFAPSRFDVSEETYTDELGMLSDENLLKISSWTGCPLKKESRKFLTSVIVHSTLKTGLTYSRLYDPYQFTESDIFDLFDSTQILPYVPDFTIPAFSQYSKTWVAQTKARSAFKYLKSCNERALSVFERIKVVNPEAERGITGSSKYFFALNGISSHGSIAKLDLSNKKSQFNVKSGDSILLMELQKPNRHGGSSRMIKNGINACGIAKVISNTDALEIEWTFPEFEDRFNAFMVLPTPHENRFADEKVSETLGGLWEQQTGKDVTYDQGKDKDENSDSGERLVKRRKTDGSSKEITNHYDKDFFDQTCPKVSECQGSPNELIHLLRTIISQPLITVKGIEGDDKRWLIDTFVKYSLGSPKKESCLVVLPTRAAVKLFVLSIKDTHKVFKYDANITLSNGSIGQIHKNLSKAADLATVLGLSSFSDPSSIRNALTLYHLHVQPVWKKYLENFNVDDYPFADFEPKFYVSSHEGIKTHYASIRKIFAILESNLPLDKFDSCDFKIHHLNEISRFFVNRCQCLLVAQEDISFIDRKFDNIIIHEESTIPLLKGGFKKLVLLGDTLVDWKTIGVSETPQNEKIDVRSSPNPNTQHISIPTSSKTPEIEEAQICVLLHKYLRLLGTPRENVSLVTKSERMQYLVHEILEEESISKEQQDSNEVNGFSYGWPIIQKTAHFAGSDFSIVSCTGSPSLREYHEMAKFTKKGLFLIGPNRDYPFKMKSGDLTLYSQAALEGHGKPQVFQKASSFKAYVEKLEKKRREDGHI